MKALRSLVGVISGITLLALSGTAFASGKATCDSGDESKWKTKEELTAFLQKEGYEVRRIKVDGGCYEAYVIGADGDTVERYYDPRDLKFIPTDD
jgi:hypothetical protein